MILNTEEITQRFSKHPKRYHQNAVLQKEISLRLLERLEYCKLVPETILDLGCGTGFMTNGIVNRYPDADFYSLDYSFNMLKFLSEQNSANIVCGDATCLPFPSNSFDLIVANLVLHWVNNSNELLLECQRVLSEDGLLLFSTLSNNSLLELKDAWGKIDNYPHVHRYFDFIELGNHLLKTFWRDPVLDREKIVIRYNSFSNLMQDLKNNGLTNSIMGRFKGLYTPKKLVELEELYLDYVDSSGKFPITYEIIYGHGLKKILRTV